MNIVFRTSGSISLLWVRLALGVVFFPHGAQKVLGWYGGAGFQGTAEAFTAMGMPLLVVYLLMAIELGGSVGLVLGLFTRLCALGIGGAMAVCAYLNHIQNGFFMNWMGNQKGEGYEFHILVAGMSLALIFGGGGLLSLDSLMGRDKRRP